MMIIDATVSGFPVADTGTGTGRRRWRRRRRPPLSPVPSSPTTRTTSAAVVPGIAATLRATAHLPTTISLPARPQEGLDGRESVAPRLPRQRGCSGFFSPSPINDAVI
ncbi:unnamed protein product, partial [Ectocarpus sp. 12 AP-2014]